MKNKKSFLMTHLRAGELDLKKKYDYFIPSCFVEQWTMF